MTRFRPAVHRLDDRLTPASGLDPAFGVGGVARVADPDPTGYTSGVEEALSDGSLLVATPVAGGGIQVTKLTPAGDLDTGYGTAGLSAVLAPDAKHTLVAAAAAPDGGLYLLATRMDPTSGGDYPTYSYTTVLYRLAADGSAAAGFPAAGAAVPPAPLPPDGTVHVLGYPSWAGVARQVLAVRTDGAVAVGQSNAVQTSVLLFTPAGALDATFGDGGRATLPEPAQYGFSPTLVAAADGQLLVVALAGNRLTATRLAAGGAVDPTYGTAGTAVVADTTASYWYQSFTAAAAPDGGLLVGWVDATRPQVRKLTAAGAADAGFGVGGAAALPELPPASVEYGWYWCGVGLPSPGLALSVRPDGGLLVVTTRTDRGAVLDLLTPAGAADPGFAGDGRLALRRLLTADESAADLVPLAGGRVALLLERGSVVVGEGVGRRVLALSATDDPADPEFVPPPEPPAGTDPGYGGDGTVDLRPTDPVPTDPPPNTYPSSAYPDVSKVLALPDGGTLVFGKLTEPDGRYGLFVGRLLADGSPDPAFGTAGRVYLDTQAGYHFISVADAALTPDGGVVFVANGNYYGARPDGLPGAARVVKLTAAGAVDRDFYAQANTDGVFDGLGGGVVSAVLVQPDGRILVGGAFDPSTASQTDPGSGLTYTSVVTRPAVRRLNPDGSPDTTFGGNGVALLTSDQANGAGVSALALGAGGRVLVVGGTSYSYGPRSVVYWDAAYGPGPGGKPFVARLTAAGQPDADFAGGVVSLEAQAGDGYSRAARWVTATADGVVVGLSLGSDTVRLVRLTAAGAVDGGYGKAGVAEVYDGRGFLGLTFGPGGAAVLATGVGYSFGSQLGLYTVAADGTLGSLGGLALPAEANRPAVTAGGVTVAPDGRVVVGFGWNTLADGRIILERTAAATDLYQPMAWGEPAVWTPREVPPVPPDRPVPPMPPVPVVYPPPVLTDTVYPVPVVPTLPPRPNPEAQSQPPAAPVVQPATTWPPDALPSPVARATVVRTDGPRVWVEDAGTGRVRLPAFAPFEAGYTGTLDAVLADLDGDGTPELVVSPADGGGPVVAVFRLDGTEVSRFFGIEDAGFRGGVRLAAGDLNGDGTADLVVTPGVGGGPRVAVYDGRSLPAGSPRRLVSDFFAFEESQRGGAFAAVVDGQLVFAAGPGGGPRVRAVDARGLLAAAPAKLDDLPLATDRFVGDPADRGGVRLLARPEAGQVLAAVGANAPVPVAGRGMPPADPLTLPGVWVG